MSVKVKICGITDEVTMQKLLALDVDFIGLVFAESKRRVTIEQAQRLTQKIPKPIQIVGVFVSPTIEEIEAVQASVPLDFVQIHGTIPSLYDSLPIIQAFHSFGEQQLEKKRQDYILLDAPSQRYVGGNGQVFDWKSVDCATLPKEKLIIAGGLTAGNVKAAIEYFQPYAVDVSSGVETDGKKDFEKIREFIKNAKE